MSRTDGVETPRRRRGVAAGPASAPQQDTPNDESGVGDVLRNRPFLLLWMAQLATQIGGNMVLYGLAIIINSRYSSATAVSALLLSFLVPAVIFSAIAGVYVDQVDRRLILITTNILRGLAYAGVVIAGDNLLLIYPLIVFVSTVTTFFGPAEASMIPILVPRRQLLAANGLFTLTMNAAFAAGFALFGPILVSVSSPQILIVVVAALYFVAAGLCWTLPAAPPITEGLTAGRAVADAEQAVETMIAQLGEGIDYIRKNRNIGWSLAYLGTAASLIGVLGVIGPGFAEKTLGLSDKGFVVVVLPLGLGIVTGILALNSYGKYVPRRRLIEGGLITLGILLMVLSVVGPLAEFLQGHVAPNAPQELSRALSVLGLVMAVGFVAGVAYIFVAVPSQTQLSEDLPEEVRGRIFGILNMLVSITSFLPIIVVAPVADLVGNPPVIFAVAVFVLLAGVTSVVTRGALGKLELLAHTTTGATHGPVDPLTAAMGGSDIAAATSYAATAEHAGAEGHGEPVVAGRVETAPEPSAEMETAPEPSAETDPVPEPRTVSPESGTVPPELRTVPPEPAAGIDVAPERTAADDIPPDSSVEAASDVKTRDALFDDGGAPHADGFGGSGQTSWLDSVPTARMPAASEETAWSGETGTRDPTTPDPGDVRPGSPPAASASPRETADAHAHRFRVRRRHPRGVIRRSPLDPEVDDDRSLWEDIASIPGSLLRRIRRRPEDDDEWE